jgi:hypothetical protein
MEEKNHKRDERKREEKKPLEIPDARRDILFLRWEEGDVRFDEEVLRLPA